MRFAARHTILLIVALPLLGGLFATWPALNNQFSNDDDILIVNNPYVHSLDHVYQNLTRDFFYSKSSRPIGYYRPITKLAFIAQYQVFGAQPFGYHLVSVALFLIAAIATSMLLFRLGFPAAVAGAAALLFATNPAQAESVGIVASQSDLWVALFMLVSCYSYVRWRQTPRWRWMAAAMSAFILALGSKEVAIVTPALFGYWELTQMDVFTWHNLRRRLHFLWFSLPVVGYAMLRIALDVLPIASDSPHSVAVQLIGTAKTFVAVVIRAVIPSLWPPYLHANMPQPTWVATATWLAPAMLFSFAATWFVCRRRHVGWFAVLLLVPIIPVLPSAVVHVSHDPRLLIVSDRWVLLPAIGGGLLCALVAQAVWQWLGDHWRFVAPAAVGLFALIQSLDARLENASFRDETTRMLWVGQALAERGRLAPAEEEQALAARAIVAEREGDLAHSADIYRRLVTLAPQDHTRRYNFSVALMQLGEFEAALEQAQIAFHGASPGGKVRLPRNDSFARNRPNRAFLLGLLQKKLGNADTAKAYFEWCLQHSPQHAAARSQLDASR